MSISTESPFCVINGEVATAERILPVATRNYGHITMLQMRNGMVRGLEHHLARLDDANHQLFGRGLPHSLVIAGLRIVAAAHPNATVRVNVFEGVAVENVMVTATPPVEPNWQPARFSLVPYERDMPRLKHVGSFGLSLRQRQAEAAGFDGAVFFNCQGEISEATIWNVGFFDRDTIVWPTAQSLRGITQIIIDEGLAAAGIEVRYEAVRIDALACYRAAFLSNSTTFGRLLSVIGDTGFETPASASDIIRTAYERTPLLSLPP